MSDALPHARRVAAFFERFQADDLDMLGEVYAQDAAFKDPFNDVTGLPAIEGVYRHMFLTLDDPRFTVWNCTAGQTDAWLAWRFSFGDRATTTVHGVSHLDFDAAGLIRAHRDYWDPAEELYERVPLLGAVLRLIKRRLAAPGASRA